MTDRTIVAISAGLGEPSATRLLADRLGQSTVRSLAGAGVPAVVETVELREIAHDVVNTMLTGFPAGGAARALELLGRADGVIAATPLFSTTYSGLFKSFVDIIDRDALDGVPVLLAATGGTARHSLALDYSLRPLFAYLRADVTPTAVFAATDDWSGAADQVSPLPERIERAGRELAAQVAARPPRRDGTPDSPFAGAPTFEDLVRGL